MKPLKPHRIYGNWATLLLPINEDQSINFNHLENEVDALIHYKVDGIYSNGTAGEFYNITEEEFDRVSAILAEKCNAANMPFQIGVSHMSPILSFNRLKRVQHLKPGAVQVILPDWFRVTNTEAVDFLRLMDSQSDIGLVLYNPPHAKRVLTVDDIHFLKSRVPGIVGVKVGNGNTKWYQDLSNIEDLSVFVPGHHLASGVAHGANGTYSNMACLNPLAAQYWYELITQDPDQALALEKRIQSFLARHVAPLIEKEKYSNQAVDKMLAAAGRWSDMSPRLRWPYRWIPEERVREIRKLAKKNIPEFFNS